MVDDVNVTEPHLQTVLTPKRAKPDTETDWMERELQETEKNGL